MNGQVLSIERGPITRLTLNRPEKLNALNAELGNAFIDALTEEGFRPEVRVLIIAGAGRAFCAGDDVSGSRPEVTYDRTEPPTYAARSHYYRMQAALRTVPKPVIAQVHGFCLGAGMDIVLASDYAVADAEAKLGLVFVKRAIAAGMVLLPQHAGLKQATRLLFEGDIISPRDALVMGLISHVSDDGRLEADVQELADRLAGGPTRVYGHIKAGLNRAYFPAMDDDLHYMALMQNFASRTSDSAEAKEAWRGRRTPQFSGV